MPRRQEGADLAKGRDAGDSDRHDPGLQHRRIWPEGRLSCAEGKAQPTKAAISSNEANRRGREFTPRPIGRRRPAQGARCCRRAPHPEGMLSEARVHRRSMRMHARVHFVIDGRVKAHLGINANVLARPVGSLDGERELHAIARPEGLAQADVTRCGIRQGPARRASGPEAAAGRPAGRLPGAWIVTPAAAALTAPTRTAPSVLVRFM